MPLDDATRAMIQDIADKWQKADNDVKITPMSYDDARWQRISNMERTLSLLIQVLASKDDQ